MSADTPRPNLELTVRAELDGWPIDLALSLPAEKVRPALERLAALGYKPRQEAAPVAPASVERRAAPRVEPVYKPDGTPCCPVHHKPLAEGRYGLFCPSRAADGEEANAKGYCALRFKD